MNAKLKLLLVTLATILVVGATTGMGVWQLSRAAEKQGRQAAMDQQTVLPPLTTQALAQHLAPSELLHRRAVLRGTWRADALIFLENRPMDGRVGFIVLAPFELEGGRGVLAVQRGWVPRRLDDRAILPAIETPSGLVDIEGRMAHPPSDLFALGVSTGGRIRQNLDLRQWGLETGLDLMPLTLQQTGPKEAPFVRDWPVVNLGVEKNWGYAVQWFAMALVSSALFIWFQIIRRFKTRPKARTDHA